MRPTVVMMPTRRWGRSLCGSAMIAVTAVLTGLAGCSQQVSRNRSELAVMLRYEGIRIDGDVRSERSATRGAGVA